jgi:rare lipoprotein A
MNGPTPTADVGAAGFPGEMLDQMATGTSSLPLPAFGPIAPERPAPDGLGQVQVAMASLSYVTDEKFSTASAFAAFDGLNPDSILRSWKRMNGDAAAVPVREPYIAAGSFTGEGEAKKLADTLAAFGRTEIEKTEIDGTVWYGVNLIGDGGSSIDDLLEAAWSHGAPDAITVRD